MESLEPLELVEQTPFSRIESHSGAAFGVKLGELLREREDQHS